MGAEHLDQTCAADDNSLCRGWLFVASWWFPTFCCDVPSLEEIRPQVSTSFRWKGNYTILTKGTEARVTKRTPVSKIGIWNL